VRTVFFGSSAFAVPALRALVRDHDVVMVYTQADRPAGRGLKMTSTHVKAAALGAGLPVETPEKLDGAFIEGVGALRPEALVCASYGKILPGALLEVPKLGALNVHPSLLPAYRGATPIQAALRDGLTRTGVSIIWMSPRMDAGDIALSREVPIESSDDFDSLHDRLADAGAEALADAMARLAAGTLERTPQDDARATFTKPLSKEDARLRFDLDAVAAANVVRALSPRPGAWFEHGGKRIKVLHARAEDGAGEPGALLHDGGDGPRLVFAHGALRLLRVVPEGKPPMSGADFARTLR
jgi:methionyl-tRNA formyltransferase